MGFKKSELSFRNKTVFEKDFRANIDKTFCVVSKMMFMNRLNVDGSINIDQVGFLKKYELWSYIYYLYYYNNTSLEEFAGMKNRENGKANALLFYKNVSSVVDNQFISNGEIMPLDVNTLAYFVNLMVRKYGADMRNPVIDYLRHILNSPEAIDKIRQFTLSTGMKPGNVTIVSNPQDVDKADIKVLWK